MIPRYQRILFWSLAGCILLMLLFLLRGCEVAHQRLTGLGDTSPLVAPVSSEMETVTLSLASDADASITPTQRQLALPEEPTLRARALLEQLMAQYALPGSAHPLQAGPAVDDIFVLTMPQPVAAGSTADTTYQGHAGQMAVVNLHGAFADHHPSGVVVEALTLQSIVGTLHTALPQVEQVRFLVDGRARETLAGHASLLRPYPATDTANRPVVPLTESR